MAKVTVAFDSETGDLLPSKGHLLTLYMGLFDEDFRLLEELDLKLKPNDGQLLLASAEALKINGINLKVHMEDPTTITYAEAKEKIMATLKRHLKRNGRYSNLIPMAYNADFDIKFVQYYILPEEEWNSILHYGKIDPKQVVDFLKDCGWIDRSVGSLGSVAEYFNVPKRNAHTAKDDTFMMLDVYKNILALMKSKKDGGNTSDLISLLESE